MMKLLTTCLVLTLAQAFNTPFQPRTGVVRNVIQSKWTMMPDEPAPEVRFEELLLLPRVLVARSEKAIRCLSCSHSSFDCFNRIIDVVLKLV